MVTIDSHTRRHSKGYDKPNEDYIFIIDAMGIFILLDGVSRDLEDNVYPEPSPALAVSELFAVNAACCLEDQFKRVTGDPVELLRNAIAYGNSKIRAYSDNFGHPFLPGTVGIVSCLLESIFYYAYIGDCIGIRIRDNTVTTFTSSQTEQIRNNKHRFTREEIRNNVCNNLEHPFCYGVLNGQDEALAFVQYGTVEVTQGDIILMMTDGMENLLALCGLEELRRVSSYELVGIVHASEQSPSKSDDKSIIKLTI